MSEAAVLSTRDVSTEVVRLEQPQAVTSQQRAIIEETWKINDTDVMQEYGMKLFKQ